MKNCNEVIEILSLYIENELNEELCIELEEHIDVCSECRKELQELQQIANLCKSITEEELPENFKQQLHEKLVLVNGSENATKALIKPFKKILPQNYIRICASIAAVFIIAVMIKVLFPLSSVSDKTTESSPTKNFTTESAQAPAAAESKIANGTASSENIQAADEYGTVVDGSADTAKSINPQTTMKEKNGNSTDDVKLFSSEQPDLKASENEAEIKSDGEEKQMVVFDAVPTTKRIDAFSASASNVIRDTDITVRVENPDIELEKIRLKAVEFGAEFDERKAMDGAGGENTGESGKIRVTLRMPYTQYNPFVSSLKAVLGESFVVTASINSIDMNENINTLQTQISSLDKKISELAAMNQTAANEELEKLKTERENMQRELSNLKRDVQYISVCLDIIRK
ncbi:MAG: DUF4349 domain-containing protein [Clostridia bacterium]|nr:DUF4349 domain-containing protein [Clostridia bacterium]